MSEMGQWRMPDYMVLVSGRENRAERERQSWKPVVLRKFIFLS